MRAYGPRFMMEYFRPIGHTKLELMASGGGAIMFGRQDQIVQNSITGDLKREGADEFLTQLKFVSGVQFRKNTGENRNWFVRGGITYETWRGGGTALLPQGDFGLRGFFFSVGYNR